MQIQAGGEDLDDHGPIQGDLPALIDRTHATATEQRGDLVWRLQSLEFVALCSWPSTLLMKA